MPHFRLQRTGNVDLEFEGVLLAEQSTRDSDDQQQWAELRIWRTDTGKYVTQRIGRSIVPGQVDKIVTRIVTEPVKVRDAVMSKQGDTTFLSNLAIDVLEDAAAADPALVVATTEQI